MYRSALNKLKKSAPKLFGYLKIAYYFVRRLNPFISSSYVYVGFGKFLSLKRMRTENLVPNLVIIGAEKSGTTSLHSYLGQHPDIFASYPNKEPHYFLPLRLTKKYYRRNNMPVHSKLDVLKNHMLKGYSGESYILEATAAYTRGDYAKRFEIPKIMKATSPEIKIIYIVRNPVDRLVSSFKHRLREGWNKADNLKDDIASDPKLMQTSDYSKQVNEYISVFGSENVKILQFERLVDSPDEVFADICKWLGIENIKFKTDKVLNQSKQNMSVEVPEDSKKILREIKEKFVTQFGIGKDWDI